MREIRNIIQNFFVDYCIKQPRCVAVRKSTGTRKGSLRQFVARWLLGEGGCLPGDFDFRVIRIEGKHNHIIARGITMDFWWGEGRIVDSYLQNTLKIWKTLTLGHFILKSGVGTR